MSIPPYYVDLELECAKARAENKELRAEIERLRAIVGPVLPLEQTAIGRDRINRAQLIADTAAFLDGLAEWLWPYMADASAHKQHAAECRAKARELRK